MAHCDVVGANGSNRILFHGAPLPRMMPNGCLGSPVIVLLFRLDRGFLMDVGPMHLFRQVTKPTYSCQFGRASVVRPVEQVTNRLYHGVRAVDV